MFSINNGRKLRVTPPQKRNRTCPAERDSQSEHMEKSRFRIGEAISIADIASPYYAEEGPDLGDSGWKTSRHPRQIRCRLFRWEKRGRFSAVRVSLREQPPPSIGRTWASPVLDRFVSHNRLSKR